MTGAQLRLFLLALIAASTDSTQPAHRGGPWVPPVDCPEPVLDELAHLVALGVLVEHGGAYHLSRLAIAARGAYRAEYLDADGVDHGPGWLADLVAWTQTADAAALPLDRLPYVGRFAPRAAA